MEEKSLIKDRKIGFFQKKIISFKETLNDKKEIKVEEKPYKNSNVNAKNKFKEENELIMLQRDYENGKIKEEELSESQKKELLTLYKKQIATLEEETAKYQRIKESYKAKIIEKRKKLLENK